jgi:tight adherence protein B
MTRCRAARGAAVLALSAFVLAGGPPAAAADGSVPAQAREVTVEDGTLRMVVSVDGLPAGEQLDPAAVSVSVGSQSWPATAQAVGGSGTSVARAAVLVVDTSGSMGAAGIADARAASERFLAVVPTDVSVGLVTFSDTAQLVVAPTADRKAVTSALAQMVPAGNTRLYDGIVVGLQALGSQGERALIVLSDGKDTASDATLAAVTEQMAASGVTSDLVAFKTEGGQVEVLADLASRTGGSVSEAASGAQLSDVFAAAARTLVNQVVVTAEVPDDAAAGTSNAVVEIDAGSQTAVTTVQFDVPAPTTATALETGAGTAATARPVVSTSIPWLLPAIVLVFFLGVFLCLTTALTPATWGRSTSALRAKEMQRYGVQGIGAQAGAGAEKPGGVATQTALGWADRAVSGRGVENTWRTALDRAQVPLRPHEWLIVRLSVALASAALAAVTLPLWLFTGTLAGLAGWLLAGAYVRFKGRRRLRRFAEGLPDVLQLVAGSLRSGFSLPQAVENAAKDGPEPIAGELSRALAESRLGVPLEDALDRVAERMSSTDLTWTVMAIRIAREVGGNLAEVLLATAETMRERGRIQRQVRVLSAEGRLSAYVLLGLPLGILLFMVAFRGDYIAPLFEDPIGWAMCTYGLISVAVGAWWMSRLIKLEV